MSFFLDSTPISIQPHVHFSLTHPHPSSLRIKTMFIRLNITQIMLCLQASPPLVHTSLPVSVHLYLEAAVAQWLTLATQSVWIFLMLENFLKN